VRTSGSKGRRGVQRAVGTLDRNVDEREGIDRLRLPVFQHLEVFLLQFANDLTCRSVTTTSTST
jgi:hypothetical protein